MALTASPLYSELTLEGGGFPMRKALLMVPAVLAATLVPSVSNAEVHKCHGQVANIVGTPGDDTIYGTGGGNDVIAGLGGNDTIFGLNAEPDHSIQEATIDTICGHGGSDTIYTGCVNAMCNGAWALGGRGADEIHGYDGHSIRLYGGPGDDTLVGPDPEDAEDQIAVYSSARGPITANLSTDIATGEGTDTLINIGGVVGTDQGDTLVGDDWQNDLTGGDGNDRIYGHGYDDSLRGGDGVDLLYGHGGDDGISAGLGDDSIDGGTGTDFLTFRASPNEVWASLIEGRAEGEGIDTLFGIEGIAGSEFDDILIGDSGSNGLSGDGGRDLLYGRRGDDSLTDSHGNGDEFYGNRGNDFLSSHNNGGLDDTPDLLDGGIDRDRCRSDEPATRISCELRGYP
jgi:Ca2+-binding RTX toxin-like protein